MQEFLIAVILLGILTAVSLIVNRKNLPAGRQGEALKYILFGGMVLVIVGYTTYLVWSTISLNIKSVTKGPVHYHGDFEIHNCGQKVDLIDPTGWDNKVGTSILHEHNDNRIHVEGPVLAYEGISLGEFFKVVGGEMGEGYLKVPTNNGVINMGPGGQCDGEFQVFVFKTKGEEFSQEKLTDPKSYVLSFESKIPPGDCIILEFDTPRDKTDKLCTFYQIAKEKGELIEK